MHEFQLSFPDWPILLYVIVLLIIATVAFIYIGRFRKPWAARSVRLLSVLFVISIAYPVFLPLWTNIEITDQRLVVEGIAFSTNVNLSEILANEIHSYEKLPDSLQVARRTNGIRISTLAIGTFQLNNGRAARAYLTRSSNFVVIPLSGRRFLILTVRDAQALIANLKLATSISV